MKLLRETIRRIVLQEYKLQLLTESMIYQAWEYFNGAYGFEEMSRREVPSKEQLSSNREVYYGKYSGEGCDTLFQLEQREYYDLVNDKHINVIWIHGIRTLGDCQGKGIGTHVMQSIVDFADTIGMGLAGSVVPYGSSKMSRDQMTAFDGKFGLMPLAHWKNFLPKETLANEDEMWEIDDYIESNSDDVYRPAGGFIR